MLPGRSPRLRARRPTIWCSRPWPRCAERVAGLRPAVSLDEEIPVAAGLGGGSADAAAALAAARARQRSRARTIRGCSERRWRWRRRAGLPRSSRARIMRGVGEHAVGRRSICRRCRRCWSIRACRCRRATCSPSFGGKAASRSSCRACRATSRRLVECLGQHGNDLTERRDRLRARHRRRAGRAARLAGRPARAHVRLGIDLLCAVCSADEAAAAAQRLKTGAQGLVGPSHHDQLGGKSSLKMPALRGTSVGLAIVDWAARRRRWK